MGREAWRRGQEGDEKERNREREGVNNVFGHWRRFECVFWKRRVGDEKISEPFILNEICGPRFGTILEQKILVHLNPPHHNKYTIIY